MLIKIGLVTARPHFYQNEWKFQKSLEDIFKTLQILGHGPLRNGCPFFKGLIKRIFGRAKWRHSSEHLSALGSIWLPLFHQTFFSKTVINAF